MGNYGWITELAMKVDEVERVRSERDSLQVSVERLRESNHRYRSRVDRLKKRVAELKESAWRLDDENSGLSEEVARVSGLLDAERESRSGIESLARDMYWDIVKHITSESVMEVDKALRYESRMEELGIEVMR